MPVRTLALATGAAATGAASAFCVVVAVLGRSRGLRSRVLLLEEEEGSLLVAGEGEAAPALRLWWWMAWLGGFSAGPYDDGRWIKMSRQTHRLGCFSGGRAPSRGRKRLYSYLSLIHRVICCTFDQSDGLKGGGGRGSETGRSSGSGRHTQGTQASEKTHRAYPGGTSAS